MEINYKLTKAAENDLDFVKNAKIASIFDYAKDISTEEKARILNYINRFMDKFLLDYQIIVKDGAKCGVFLVREYEDGVLIDEIFLTPEYRGLGIGSSVIKTELKKHNKVYLWVYKENVGAIKLYQKLGFNVFEDNGERYLMLYENQSK